MLNSFFSNNNVYSYDWGEVTVDGFNKEKNEALIVYNFDISSLEKVNYCLIFMIGRAFWLERQLPNNATQRVVLDLRGQPITLVDKARKMKQNFMDQLKTLNVKSSVIVEILI